MSNTWKGYKAFGPGMVCRGKQYAENTVFEEEDAIPCQCGMHYCEKPLDVLKYYDLVDRNGNVNEFAEVEALDKPVTNDDVKFVTKKLKIGEKISFPALVQAAVHLEIKKMPTDTKVKTTSKKNAQIGSSGDGARIGSSGYGAQIGSSGDYARIGSSGYGAQIGSSGDGARIGSTGKHSVVCCAGANCTAKAKRGSWITLSEWEYSEEERTYIPVCVKSVQVDGEVIKEDTFYKLENGTFVEVG